MSTLKIERKTLTELRDALLALRLANEMAPSLSQSQKNANAKADAALKLLEQRKPANAELSGAGTASA